MANENVFQIQDEIVTEGLKTFDDAAVEDGMTFAALLKNRRSIRRYQDRQPGDLQS